MRSNFDDPLPLSADRRTITAKGLLVWEDGDAEHCRISATLSQGDLSNSCATGNYGHDKRRWKCDVVAPNGAQWDVDQLVHCIGKITMSAPPPAKGWDPQDVSLELEQTAAPA